MNVNIEIAFLNFIKNEFLSLRGLWFGPLDGRAVKLWIRYKLLLYNFILCFRLKQVDVFLSNRCVVFDVQNCTWIAS